MRQDIFVFWITLVVNKRQYYEKALDAFGKPVPFRNRLGCLCSQLEAAKDGAEPWLQRAVNSGPFFKLLVSYGTLHDGCMC
jgi:hypothetical protein